MRWTKDKPSDTGWYWFRAKGLKEVQVVVEVFFFDGALACQIPPINFMGKLADLESRLSIFNVTRRNSGYAKITALQWSDKRLPIPQ